MKHEEVLKIREANRDLFVLATNLEKRFEIDGTDIDKIIVNLLKNVTFILDEIQNLEDCKPF